MAYNASVKFQYINDTEPSYNKHFPELVDQMTVNIEAPAQDLNIWQYYELFKSFLRCVGFQEYSIMEGACRLAFNDSNNEDDMKKIMKEYELQDRQIHTDDDYYALQEEFEELKKKYEELKKNTLKDDCMPPWGHSDMEALRYTDEELNAMCDAAEKVPTYDDMIASGHEMTADGFWIPKEINETIKITTNNPMIAWNGLIPGSDEAVKKGCKCPVMDNAEMPEYRKWVNGDCPLHGRAK